MKRILYIPFDHLHRKYGVLASADPKNDVVVLVESKRMCSGRNWHPERLFFLISSARHFVATLKEEGFAVEYIKAATTIDGLAAAKKKLFGWNVTPYFLSDSDCLNDEGSAQ